MTRPASNSAAVREDCRACGAPLLVQWVGRVAALHVRADAQPMKHADAMALQNDNRLVWHLHRLALGGVELRDINPGLHDVDCPDDVIEHACQAPRLPAQPPQQRRGRTEPTQGQGDLFRDDNATR